MLYKLDFLMKTKLICSLSYFQEERTFGYPHNFSKHFYEIHEKHGQVF